MTNDISQKSFSTKSVLLKFIGPVALLAVFFIIFLFFAIFPAMERYLMEDKKKLIVEQVRTAENILSHFRGLENDGVMSAHEAQHKAREVLREVRFGEDRENYFFIIDQHLVSIMHPLRKSLEGQDMSQVEDANKKKYIAELVETALKNGEGFVTYEWFTDSERKHSAPKISYVKYFKPWNWIIGTGIFINDIESLIQTQKGGAVRMIAVFIVVSGILIAFILRNSLITEKQRVASETKRTLSEAYYRTLFESSQDAILTITPPKWHYTDANSAACRLFGLDTTLAFTVLHPKHLSPEFQPDGSPSRKLALQHISNALEKGSDYFEWVHKKTDGTLFESTVLISKVSLPGGIVLMGNIRDVSAEKKAIRMLKESEENLRTTLHSIGDAVISTDIQGHIVRMNAIASRLTGWTPEEASGLALSEVFRIINGETRVPLVNPVDQVLRSGHAVTLSNHTLLISKSGREFEIADSAAPILNDKGAISGVVLVFRDVTEQHSLEAQLRQSQKMESIGRLAGGVAHDFNNILGGIIGAAELLKEELKDRPDLLSLVSMILDASERTSSLTRKLLAFSRKGSLQSLPMDMIQVIREALQLVEKSLDPRITVQLDLGPGPMTVMGDPGQMTNVLLNLFINARDAMPEGGTLWVECKSAPGSRIDGFQDSDMVAAISVRDTGVGIEKEIQERIFEPFFTTKPVGSGTGLGLSAVFGTVQEHHGRLTLYSEPGKGTEFKLFFPMFQGSPFMEALPEKKNFTRLRILLAEDDEILRDVITRHMDRLNIPVIAAEDGEKAVELFSEKPLSFDLVLLDMTMPLKNGRDTFLEMKKIRSDLKAAFISGFDLEGVHSDILSEPGVIGFLQKPFPINELINLLKKIS